MSIERFLGGVVFWSIAAGGLHLFYGLPFGLEVHTIGLLVGMAAVQALDTIIHRRRINTIMMDRWMETAHLAELLDEIDAFLRVLKAEKP